MLLRRALEFSDLSLQTGVISLQSAQTLRIKSTTQLSRFTHQRLCRLIRRFFNNWREHTTGAQRIFQLTQSSLDAGILV